MMRRTEKLKEAFEGACPQRIWKSRPIDEGLFVINCDGMNQTDAELCGASMVHEGNLGKFPLKVLVNILALYMHSLWSIAYGRIV